MNTDKSFIYHNENQRINYATKSTFYLYLKKASLIYLLLFSYFFTLYFTNVITRGRRLFYRYRSWDYFMAKRWNFLKVQSLHKLCVYHFICINLHHVPLFSLMFKIFFFTFLLSWLNFLFILFLFFLLGIFPSKLYFIIIYIQFILFIVYTIIVYTIYDVHDIWCIWYFIIYKDTWLWSISYVKKLCF